jgi:hypothetical protein
MVQDPYRPRTQKSVCIIARMTKFVPPHQTVADEWRPMPGWVQAGHSSRQMAPRGRLGDVVALPVFCIQTVGGRIE